MKTSEKNFQNAKADEYVEPGHDVESLRYADKEQKFPDGTAVRRLDQQLIQQITDLTNAVDRLQRRVEELERREPW